MDGKLYSVQYLRGLAALLVVVAHASAHPLAGPEWWQLRLGQFGVYLFFVISGFIMVAISGERFSPLTFLRRRAIRIVPLYWLFTTLAALLALASPSLFKSTVFTPDHYLQSLLFIPHEAPGRGGTSPLLSLGWTLNYEVFFYIAFAALAILAATGRVVVLTCGFVALYVLGAVFQPTDPALQFYMNAAVLAFAAGAWVGLAYLRGTIRRLPGWTVPAIGLVGFVGFVAAFVLDTSVGETEVSFIGLVVLAAALVALGLKQERSLPRSRMLELLGDASYATYLVHMFVIGALVAIGTRILPAGEVSYAMIVLAAIVVSLGGGIVVHRFIELPMLAWFRRPTARARAIATPAE